MLSVLSDQQRDQDIEQGLKACQAATRKLALLQEAAINQVILTLADLAEADTQHLITENRKDLERMDPDNPKYDRLLLNEKRIQDIAADLRKVASLPSPLHHTLEQKTLPNGLDLSRISTPIGVIGIVYESRPNVTFDVFSLCLKAGNACVLKGSRDAHYSNLAIYALIQQALEQVNLPHACYLAPSEREALQPVLEAVGLVDAIIPRGSQGLIDHVRLNAKVPVIETGAGIVHIYYDASADAAKAALIIENAKSRRVSVCNALDTLLIHAERLADLPALLQALGQKHACEVFACERSYLTLQAEYPAHLLKQATTNDFGTEFLSMKMSVKVVDSMQDALDHIAQYSSKHTECILAEDEHAQQLFLRSVDAAVVMTNTSTGFTDGAQFDLGAEIGISTQKLHARGPMALRELCSYKWIVKGNGQIRS